MQGKLHEVVEMKFAKLYEWSNAIKLAKLYERSNSRTVKSMIFVKLHVDKVDQVNEIKLVMWHKWS